MKKIFLLLCSTCAFLFAVIPATRAQTISPLVQECGKKCTGSFTVRNDQLKPVAFTVESYSTQFTTGASRPMPVPVRAGTTVQLSETSGRLGPKEVRQIDFKISCAQLPCGLTFLTGMITGHASDGLAVRLILPFSVYACDKAKGCRLRILAAAKIIPPEQKK